MTRKFVLYLTCLAVLVGVLFSAVVSADVAVGVKKGDWIEYNVTATGDVPEEHNVTWCKIEIIAVEEKTIGVEITSRYSDGREETATASLNLETGQIGYDFIIPAKLDSGDTFLKNENNVTISGVEERTYVGANRKVVYANASQTLFYWDRSTGILVEATSSYPDFTIITEVEETNMWQAQIFGIDPFVFIVPIIAVIVAVLAIFLIRKMKK